MHMISKKASTNVFCFLHTVSWRQKTKIDVLLSKIREKRGRPKAQHGRRLKHTHILLDLLVKETDEKKQQKVNQSLCIFFQSL